jgi:hypothetical protein
MRFSAMTNHIPTHDHGATVAAEHGVVRSHHWPTVEKEFREKYPHCAACVDTDENRAVQVHHVNPFHYLVDPTIDRPDLELDDRNLIGLCEDEQGRPAKDHHIDLGHLGNFKEGNLLVRTDAATKYHGMPHELVRSDPEWLSEEREGRLKALNLMTADEKEAFRVRLWKELPPDPAILQRFSITLKLGMPVT